MFAQVAKVGRIGLGNISRGAGTLPRASEIVVIPGFLSVTIRYQFAPVFGIASWTRPGFIPGAVVPTGGSTTRPYPLRGAVDRR